MKRNSKLFAIILAFILIFTSAPAATAVGAEPGASDSASFSFSGIYGVDGSISFSNSSIFSDISYDESGSLDGSVSGGSAYFYSSDAGSVTITVNVRIADSAKSGDSCDITFTYRTSDVNGNMSDWQTVTRTITVDGHSCRDNNRDHKCDICGTALSSCGDSNGDHKCDTCGATLSSCGDGNNDHKCDTCGAALSSCNDGNNDHKCDVCGAKLSSCVDKNKNLKCDICGAAVEPPIDYTELDKQLDIAGKLNEDEYTEDSWKALLAVLEDAKDARKNGKQKDVDAAAKALAEAISKLVKMDYTKLLAALDHAKNVGNEQVADLIERLIAAIEGANAALDSNDQKTVDAAAAELEAVIADLEKALDELKVTETETVEVEKEVIVEVEPSEPFCNISWHDLLLILLIISLILNVALGVMYTNAKKKKQEQ